MNKSTVSKKYYWIMFGGVSVMIFAALLLVTVVGSPITITMLFYMLLYLIGTVIGSLSGLIILYKKGSI